MRFVLCSLGCRANQYEIRAIKRQLEAVGCTEVAEGECADICIINTCAVTKSAESSSRNKIRGLAAAHPGARVVVTGCLAAHNPEELENLEGVTDIYADKEQLVNYLLPGESACAFAIDRFDGNTRAFIKIQDGCDNFCSYCIIPYLRGRSRSRACSDIIQEARRVVDNGHKEIVITGIDIGDYRDGEKRLADLIHALDHIQDLQRVRLSSINPHQVDTRLIDVLLNGRTPCHSLHLVLQSGSNTVLERMRRPYTRELFLEKVQQLPNFLFTTDIIVGFPGETDEDFNLTMDIVERVRFLKVHMFPYSVRPGTRSARWIDTVHHQTIAERKNRLLEKARNIAREVREEYIGQEMEVLTENTVEGSWRTAQAKNGLPVMVFKQSVKANQLVRVCLDHNGEEALFGSV